MCDLFMWLNIDSACWSNCSSLSWSFITMIVNCRGRE
jgi:hypothetical protein